MKWRDRISNVWWTIVARVNRKAYLVHATKDPFCGFQINEELLWLTTQEWTRRGEKVNVWIEDVPVPEGVKTPWAEALSGPNYIRWDILCKFRKIVEDAEYEKAAAARRTGDVGKVLHRSSGGGGRSGRSGINCEPVFIKQKKVNAGKPTGRSADQEPSSN